MKHPIISIVIITFLFLILSSCGKDENWTVISDSSVLKTFQNGSWRVTQYIDCGDDETYHFAGYTFSLDSTGIVSAANGTSLVNGTWNLRTDENQNKFDLNFGKIHPLHKLNDDWHIIEQSSEKIRLEDVGKKSGEVELLTLEKY